MANVNVNPTTQISTLKSGEIKLKMANDSNLQISEISEAIQKAQLKKDKTTETTKKATKLALILSNINLKFVNVNDEQKTEKLDYFDKNISYGFLPEKYKKGYAKRDGQIIKFEFSDNRILFQRRDLVLETKRFHIREFGKFTFAEILEKFQLVEISANQIETAKKEFSDDFNKNLVAEATAKSNSNTVDKLHELKEIAKSDTKVYTKAIAIKTKVAKIEKVNLAAKTVSQPAKNMVITKKKKAA